MRLKRIGTAFVIAVALLLHHEPASAVSFDVKPIKVFFDARLKAEKLTITNTADEELTLQLRVYKWSEDAEGKDVYEETKDIVLFPKLLKLNKGEARIIRVGTKSPPSANERTYRIYAEEIPITRSAAKGAEVHFLMKVGIPLFISPVKPEEHGKIESVSMKNGNLDVHVHNDGNMHFSLLSIGLKAKNRNGDELFAKDFGGWYLLGSASRLYSTPVPKDICPRISSVDVEVKTENFTLKERLDVTAKMCQQ